MFRELERKHKQIPMADCIRVLEEETRGVLSVQGDDGYPYGMPMNHFYNADDGCIWFHSGNVGHRLESLRKNDKVSFCTWDKGFREEGEWAWKVRSVIVFGHIREVEDQAHALEMIRGLARKFTDDEGYIEHEIQSAARHVLCLELTPDHITGKLVNES